MKFEYITDRLVLKVLTPDYAPWVLQFVQDGREAFEPYEMKKPDNFYTEDFQELTLKGELNAFMDGEYMRYYVFLNDSFKDIIGTVSFGHITRGAYHSAIIGYKFLPKYQKHGYATEAVMYLLEQLFTDLHLHRIIAYTLPDNEASNRLLSRVGFEKECVAKSIISINGTFLDHNQYAIINPYD